MKKKKVEEREEEEDKGARQVTATALEGKKIESKPRRGGTRGRMVVQRYVLSARNAGCYGAHATPTQVRQRAQAAPGGLLRCKGSHRDEDWSMDWRNEEEGENFSRRQRSARGSPRSDSTSSSSSQNYVRIAEPYYEERTAPAYARAQGYSYRGQATNPIKSRRKVVKALGLGALGWLAFKGLGIIFGVDDEYIWEENGYLYLQDKTGTYNLGPDPDGSKAAEFT